MKHTHLIASLLLLLMLAFSVNAQTADKITGTFAPTETCKVSYTISPQPVANNMRVDIYVSQPCNLNVHVVDAEGKELIAINSGTVSRGLGKDVDLSSLSSGNYYLEIIYGNNEQSQRVAITKS